MCGWFTDLLFESVFVYRARVEVGKRISLVSFFGFEARCGRPENQYHISDSGRVGAYALVKLLGSGVQDVGSGASVSTAISLESRSYRMERAHPVEDLIWRYRIRMKA